MVRVLPPVPAGFRGTTAEKPPNHHVGTEYVVYMIEIDREIGENPPPPAAFSVAGALAILTLAGAFPIGSRFLKWTRFLTPATAAGVYPGK